MNPIDHPHGGGEKVKRQVVERPLRHGVSRVKGKEKSHL